MIYPLLPSSYFFLLLGFGVPQVPTNNTYVAKINPYYQKDVLGALIEFDSRGSYVLNGADPKYYYWKVSKAPIGSLTTQISFTSIDKIQFVPDVVGSYEIELRVGDDFGVSPPIKALIDISLLLTSEGQEIIPDSKWIWNLLGDYYSLLE